MGLRRPDDPPLLEQAERSRAAGDWRGAADVLTRAAAAAGPARGRLLWQLAGCRLAAEQEAAAFRACEEALTLVAPRTAAEWCLAARSAEAVGLRPRHLERVRAGLTAHPATPELIVHLARACRAAGDWKPAQAALPGLLRVADRPAYARAVWLQCATAVAVRDRSLAAAAARRVAAAPELFVGPLEPLRAFAAVADPADEPDPDRLPPGGPWDALRVRTDLRRLARRGACAELTAGLRAADGPERQWLGRTAARAAAARPVEAADLALAEGDPDLRRALAADLLRHAASAWNATGAPTPAAVAELAGRVAAAAPLPAPLRLWHAVLEALAGRTPAPPETDCPPPLLPVRAWLAATAGEAGWVELAGRAVREHPDSPLAGHLGSRLAGQLAAAGDWAAAAAALGAPAADPAGVVARLGGEDWLVRWHDAWAAYTRRDWTGAVAAGVAAAQSRGGVVSPALVGLILRAADQAGGQSAPAEAAGWRPDADPTTSLPWTQLLARGLPALAHHELRSRLRAGGETAAELHGYAVLGLFLARQSGGDGKPLAALRRLAGALGAWTKLLRSDDAMARFAAVRFAGYRHGADPPDPATVRDLLAGAIVAALPDLAPPCGLDPGHLALAWRLEGHGLSAAVRHDRPAHGPLLSVALGTATSVRDAARAADEDEGRRGAFARRLFELFGVASAGPGGEPPPREPGGPEIRRLFSPLGPASVMIIDRQYAAARDELARFEAGAAAPTDPLARLLAELGPADDPAWFRPAAAELALECQLRLSQEEASRAPADLPAVRAAWAATLARAAALGTGAEVRRCVGEIAVGRARALFAPARRGGDSRPAAARHEEAVALLELAWDMTRDPTAQAGLAEHLNTRAVDRHRGGDPDGATADLLRALEVNDAARRAAENLTAVVGRRLDERAGDDPAAVGEWLGGILARLEPPAGERQWCRDELRRYAAGRGVPLPDRGGPAGGWAAEVFRAADAAGLSRPAGESAALYDAARAAAAADQPDRAVDLLGRALRAGHPGEATRAVLTDLGTAWGGRLAAAGDWTGMMEASRRVQGLLHDS